MPKSTVIEIPQSPFDRAFRKQVASLYNLAKKEAIIMAGELSSYDFIDIRGAFDDALERGVVVEVYATSPPVHTVNRLVLKGVNVYVGRIKLRDHYTIVDRKHWIESKEHPPFTVGERRGDAHYDDPIGAKKLIGDFERYISDVMTKKHTSIDWQNDPVLTVKQ